MTSGYSSSASVKTAPLRCPSGQRQWKVVDVSDFTIGRLWCSRRTTVYRDSVTGGLPPEHRQGVERVLPPSIDRQFHEPSMKARVRPRAGDIRDERTREAEPA